MEKLDYKKKEKELYLPKKEPEIVQVPEMTFISVKGRGNPNTSQDYAAALEVLYGLSYGIKMSKMRGAEPAGYFEYVVPPLEGLWWMDGQAHDGIDFTDKDRFCWISMIRQPEFVTEEVFEAAKEALQEKKRDLDLSKAELICFEEGLCCQILHVGSYDDEPASIKKIESFLEESEYMEDFTEERRHHEIYLSDPRRTAPEKLKTVIRHPVKRRDR